MNVDVRSVDAVLGGEAPIALDELVLAVWKDCEAFIEEARLQIERKRMRCFITDEGEYEILALLNRIRF